MGHKQEAKAREVPSGTRVTPQMQRLEVVRFVGGSIKIENVQPSEKATSLKGRN